MQRGWITALLAFSCGFATGPRPALAQTPLAPTWPIMPTDPGECAAFSRDLNKYEAEVSKQHEACLSAGKADRPSEAANSFLCSRSACQSLHDILYGDVFYTNVKPLRKKVDECYSQVKEYLDRKARERQETDDREKAVADRQEAEKTERMKDDGQARASAPQRDRSSAIQQHEQVGESNTPGTSTMGGQAPPSNQDSKDALAAIKDPFARAQKEATALGMRDPKVVDPFSSPTVRNDTSSNSAGLVDPFKEGSASKQDSDIPEDAGRSAEDLLKTQLDAMKETIKKDKAAAKEGLSAANYRKFAEGADAAESATSAVTFVIGTLEYAALAKNIYEADVPEARKREVARFVAQFGKDVTSYAFSRDAVKEGIKRVVVKTFPETVAPYLEYVSPATAAAGILLDSSDAETPGLLRYEKWGALSSKQKQQVLTQWWGYYDRDIQAGRPGDLAAEDLKVLMDQTDSLYKANTGKP